MRGDCGLCGVPGELQRSHIIPKFVFRWQKKTSPTGYLRTGQTIDRRQQDGFTQEMLCKKCEGDLSVFENRFKASIFDNAVQKKPSKFTYDQWLSKFALSVVWRATQMDQFGGTVGSQLDDRSKALLDNAIAHWRNQLLGNESSYGRFPIHIFEHWQLHDANHEDLPGIWNRYLNRHSVIRLIKNDPTELFVVYVKMGPVAIFGHISKPKKRWRGTRINTAKGIYDSTDVRLPEDIFYLYMYEAQDHHELISSVSEKQQDIIYDTMTSDIERAKDSDSWRDVLADVSRFNKNAFIQKK
ncbi:hypothetical protein ACSSV8_001045 [Roseovarius sp. MBR-79]|jgi:hypothetical protein